MNRDVGGDVPSPPNPPFLLAGAGAALAYLLLILPAFFHARFDPSVFVVAGDHFVAGAPIIVRPHSFGYDGQFYYAMALNPAAPAAQAGGVTFDHPAWRWQRIFYPLVGFALSFGQARALPAAMLAVNLICVAALGVLGRRAARHWGPGGLPLWAFLLWPGFMTCLTHDTTELLACALLLGAAMAWLRGWLVTFAILAACATLTRETSSLMLAGLVMALVAERLARGAATDWARPAMAAAAALVPVILWHAWLAHLWHGAAQAAPLNANLGWPLVGVAQRVAQSLHDAAAGGVGGKARLMAAYAAVVAAGIVAFCVWVAASLPPLMRQGGRAAALGVGWLCMVALICLLSARGPWIDPTAIFRAFSECWVVGWLILLLAGVRLRLVAGLALLPLALMNWQICLVQVR